MLLNCLLLTNSVLFANFANVSQKKIIIKQRSVTVLLPTALISNYELHSSSNQYNKHLTLTT